MATIIGFDFGTGHIGVATGKYRDKGNVYKCYLAFHDYQCVALYHDVSV